MKPALNSKTVMMAIILLLIVLLIFQYTRPPDVTDTTEYELRIDSLASANVLLLEAAEAAEEERKALRAQILALDSTIAKQDNTITNLNRRRNETNRRIDGLDTDGLIDFFSGFNAPADSTRR